MKFPMVAMSSSPSITCCPAHCERRAGWQALAGLQAGTGVVGLLRLARLGLSLGSSVSEQPPAQCAQRRRWRGCCLAVPSGVMAGVFREAEAVEQGGEGGGGAAGSASGARGWRGAKKLQSQIEEWWRSGREPDAAMYEAALQAIAEASRPPKAPGHVQAKRWDQGAALRLFRRICERGAALTVGMYNAVLAACARERAWEWSLYLLRDMEGRGLVPDSATFEHIVLACVRSHRWDWAVRMLSEMERRGLTPSLSTYHRVLDCCARLQEWRTVYELFRHMEASGVPLTSVAYEIAMRACGHGGNWRWALALLSEGRQQGCLPRESASYSAAMDACGSRRWVLAVELLAGMEREGLEPDQFVFAAAARACRAAEEEEHAERLDEQRVTAQERDKAAAAAAASARPAPDRRVRRPRAPPPEVMARLDWGLW